MLERTPFDETFLKVACYHLVPPIGATDLAALNAARAAHPIFASAKIDASDVEAASALEEFGFRRICTQILLRCSLDHQASLADVARITDKIDLSCADVLVHAAQLTKGRFRQDSLIDPDAAIELYAAWVRNSTRGGKRVAAIDRNFLSFEDRQDVRWIDLVSVLDQRRGMAVRLLGTIIDDARQRHLQQVKVVTDADNVAALRAYAAVGFEPERSLVVFHLLSASGDGTE
jgi:GNAT superfamily N-acetyltransferase